MRQWEWGLGRGCSLPSRLGSPKERRELSQSVPGAEPWPQTPFYHFLSVAERFRRKENAILLLIILTFIKWNNFQVNILVHIFHDNIDKCNCGDILK